ncbi:MAG: DUF4416 family protein [Thermodesulfovibrionales bacterium]|nr:DUF4416 family protein [Thermodesulfovibrionales bacterium]
MEQKKGKKPQKALLFIGILYTKEDFYLEALKHIRFYFDDIAMITPSMIWDFSNYYKEELGDNILRRFIFLKNLIDQDSIVDIKIITNEIEKILSINNKRQVNLDPGYLTLAKIVLASTKDYSHRIYLKNGIFAEVTLIYKNKSFISHLNTYKDYQDTRYINIFNSARNLYRLILQD